MGKGRLEAFSDGVFAVVITIMVLELKVPLGVTPEALLDDWPIFVSYVLSFIVIALTWNNHHNLFHAVQRVSGGLLWANMNLLFWLSLIPFTTGWMGENHFAPWPVFFYSVNTLVATLAYTLLTWTAVQVHGRQSELAHAVGLNWKAIATIAIYCAAVLLAYFGSSLAFVLLVLGAAIWFIPDRRFEKR